MKTPSQKKPIAFIISLMMFSGMIHAQWTISGTNIFNNNTGNVGIGTAAPGAKLHLSSTVSGEIAKFNGGASSMYMGLYENGLYRGYIGSYSGNNEDVDFGTGGGTIGKLHLTIQASPKLTVDNTGRVGIGTTSPVQRLQVAGASVLANNTSIDVNTNPNSVIAGTIIDAGGTVTSGIGGKSSGPGTAWAVGGTATAVKFNFSNGVANNTMQTAMEILSNRNVLLVPQSGNVGIGVTNPTFKLDVCGTIRAKEIRVESNWCDYVFNSNYKLPSLSFVESFIKTHKHLPDVTPGPQIEKNGLELAKVSSQMIRKIEELTLYVIELQKQVDILKKSKPKK